MALNDAPKRAAAPRKREEVYSALRRRIILSELRDGQSITELELAASMGCSQGTVREALLRLQEEGLVVRQGYRGSMVSPLSGHEAHAFLQLRAQLESQALAHSVPMLQPAQLETLSQLVYDMEETARAGDEYALFELDQAFHTTLFRVAGMPALVPVLVRCSLYNHRNKISLTNAPRTLMETATRHWAIVRALERADVAEAQRVLRHHVQSVVGSDAGGDADSAGEVAGGSALVMTSMQRVLFEQVAREDASLPPITDLPRAQALVQFEQVNERWNGIMLAQFDLRESSMPASPAAGGAGRDVGLLHVRHRSSHVAAKGCIVHVHGGGWTFGNNRTHLGAMARLAALTGCEVIGVDYALAPDHPFPAGLNDCLWAWCWLRARCDAPTPWFVAGDSAGANLALAMMLDLRHLGEPMPDAALLFYGVSDCDHQTESPRLCGAGQFGLSSERMHWYRSQYLSGRLRNPKDHRVSPLGADLNNLPPLFLNAAGLDPLCDDTLALADKLARTNTPFEFHRCEGVVHGFMQMASRLPQAQQAFEDAAAFIRSRQHAGTPAQPRKGDSP